METALLAAVATGCRPVRLHIEWRGGATPCAGKGGMHRKWGYGGGRGVWRLNFKAGGAALRRTLNGRAGREVELAILGDGLCNVDGREAVGFLYGAA